MLIERRATLEVGPTDEEARTLEVVASTFSDVQRAGYVERLDPSGFDVEALAGRPVLDSHRRDGLASLIGTVVAARIEDGKLVATLRLSERAAGLFGDIRQGIKPAVSIGFTVERWRTEGAVRTAVRWTIHEISLVPIGADSGATVRQQENAMPDTTEAAPEAMNRAQDELAIRSLVKAARLPAELADELVGLEMTRDEARQVVVDRWRQRQAAEPAISTLATGSYDDPGFRSRCMGEALYARANPEHQLSEPARGWYGLTMPDLARECLRANGENTTGLAPATLIERALSTSDLPVALTEAVRRSVAAGYNRPASALRQFATTRTAPDFREREVVRFGDPENLERLRDGGEIRYGSLAETAQTYRVTSWARGLTFTRQALINDDLGVLSSVPSKLGNASRETEDQQLADVLTEASGAGPVMHDGTRMFHASHGNLASGGAIAGPTLAAARLAMRRQTDEFGRRIAVVPRFVVVPPELETAGQQMLAVIQPSATANVNPFSTLQLVVEPRLTNATRWYLVGTGAEGLAFVRLEGRTGPQVDSTVDFDTKSVKFSVINDFAVTALDWRAWYSNPGT